MTRPPEMSHNDIVRARMQVLRHEHGDLDLAIAALEAQGPQHSLSIQRLKRKKLALKDQIARLEDELIPDIIA